MTANDGAMNGTAVIRLFNDKNCQTNDPLMLSGQCVASMENEQKPYYKRVASCIVDAGTWLLYNGDNYSHGAVVLTPGQYNDLGDHLLDSSTALRSIRPLPPASDATLVLFQDTTFCGESLVLNSDCDDLSSVGSRRDLCGDAATSFGVSSAIVVSGRWTLWTEKYGAGQSQIIAHKDTSNVTPGAYPTLDHNDGSKSALVSHAESTDGWSWMESLPDAISLALLTIPGTHDSGAIRGFIPIVDDISQCQYMTALEQLNVGIRFFDLRLNANLEVQHGSGVLSRDEGTTLGQWCWAIAYFLTLQPKECVILSIDCEGSVPDGFVGSITDTFAAVSGYTFNYFSDTSIPTLGAVRGKVVILRRFAYSGAFGWDCSNGWLHTGPFTISLNAKDRIKGQDQYDLAEMADPNMDTKWGVIAAQINAASGNTDAHTLYINFLSGAGDGTSGGLPWPVSVALGNTTLAKLDSSVEGMNYRLLDRLTNNPPSGPLGILVMDFPDKPAKLLNAIIALNHVSR